MKPITRILLFLLGIAIVAGGAGIYYVQTHYAGIGLPWVKSIALPEFPQLPQPQQQLTADSQGDIFFTTRSPYDFSELLNNYQNTRQHTGRGQLLLPAAASADNPVPAMIILHGSGGIAPEREPAYARFFADHGIAGFVLDYYSVRGATDASSYLLKTLSASDFDIVSDAYSALKVLGSHPAIDASRIGVTGYSYGGMATRYALDSRLKTIIAPDVPRFALHIDIYGPCHQTLGAEERTTGAPYLAIHGDRDNSVDPQQCARLREKLALSSPVDSLVIAGAGHAWERNIPLDTYNFPYIRGCTFSFQPETGRPTINGQLIAAPGPNATRGERALARVNIRRIAPDCIKSGYIMGNDPKSYALAKAKMLAFMRKHFALEG